MKRVKQIFIPILFIVPAAVGFVGYSIESYSFLDSLYGAICLYLFSPVFDEMNPLIEIARWIGPLATASGIIIAIKDIAMHMKRWAASLHKEATVVYAAADDENAKKLAKTCKHGFVSEIPEDGEIVFYADAIDQILLLPNDEANLAFYAEHKAEFSDKNVYIKLDRTNSFLLNESDVHFFNLNEIIAFDYWKKENLSPLYKEYIEKNSGERFSVDIAILGFDTLGEKLLDYGVLLNLYDLNQKITYHIFGEASLYKNLHAELNLMNDDAIVFHDNEWYEELEVLSSCLRIIITDSADTALIESILSTCVDSEVFIYSKEGISFSELYKFPRIKEFGDFEAIFTEDEIKNESRLIAAKKLNHKYATLYGEAKDMETAWKTLDGFTKASNIASTNYHYIRKAILSLKDELNEFVSEDELGRIEHIRWCRFHFLNHWKYGVPANGNAKDAAKQIHTCLVPYDELSEANKRKDYEAVELLLEQF